MKDGLDEIDDMTLTGSSLVEYHHRSDSASHMIGTVDARTPRDRLEPVIINDIPRILAATFIYSSSTPLHSTLHLLYLTHDRQQLATPVNRTLHNGHENHSSFVSAARYAFLESKQEVLLAITY